MTGIAIRDAVPDDFDSITKLNDAEVQKTSPMDLEKLTSLAQMSCYHKVAVMGGHVAAFLLAMREGAPYQNDNYTWFSSRFQQFIYIDRVVVGFSFSGLKIGSLLYKDMFAFARSKGINNVTCEYNIDPPNPISQAFHEKFGFKELGTQWVANNTKLVSLQAAETCLGF